MSSIGRAIIVAIPVIRSVPDPVTSFALCLSNSPKSLVVFVANHFDEIVLGVRCDSKGVNRDWFVRPRVVDYFPSLRSGIFEKNLLEQLKQIFRIEVL